MWCIQSLKWFNKVCLCVRHFISSFSISYISYVFTCSPLSWLSGRPVWRRTTLTSWPPSTSGTDTLERWNYQIIPDDVHLHVCSLYYERVVQVASPFHICSLLSAGVWYDPLRPGNSRTVRSGPADDQADGRSSGLCAAWVFHGGHVQTGRLAHQQQRFHFALVFWTHVVMF